MGGPAARLLDQEGFLLEFARFHFIAHPTRRHSTPRPGQLWIFLASILCGDLAPFQGAAAAATAPPVADVSPGAAARPPRRSSWRRSSLALLVSAAPTSSRSFISASIDNE